MSFFQENLCFDNCEGELELDPTASIKLQAKQNSSYTRIGKCAADRTKASR